MVAQERACHCFDTAPGFGWLRLHATAVLAIALFAVGPAALHLHVCAHAACRCTKRKPSHRSRLECTSVSRLPQRRDSTLQGATANQEPQCAAQPQPPHPSETESRVRSEECMSCAGRALFWLVCRTVLRGLLALRVSFVNCRCSCRLSCSDRDECSRARLRQLTRSSVLLLSVTAFCLFGDMEFGHCHWRVYSCTAVQC